MQGLENLTHAIEPTPTGVHVSFSAVIEPQLAISIAEQALAMGEVAEDPMQRTFFTEVARQLNDAAITCLSKSQQ